MIDKLLLLEQRNQLCVLHPCLPFSLSSKKPRVKMASAHMIHFKSSRSMICAINFNNDEMHNVSICISRATIHYIVSMSIYDNLYTFSHLHALPITLHLPKCHLVPADDSFFFFFLNISQPTAFGNTFVKRKIVESTM